MLGQQDWMRSSYFWSGCNNATGLTDALMDSVPIICLSGQVPTHLIGTDAFQRLIQPVFQDHVQSIIIYKRC